MADIPLRWSQCEEFTRYEFIHTSMESAHGGKYILDGRIETPSGKRPIVRTVWIVDRGVEMPRLVTAYPQET